MSPVKAAAPLLARCEERLHAAVSGHATEVGRPASETLAAGGKRVRPLLVFCSAPRVAPGAVGPAQDGLLSAAVAVELVHMATLVHDDLLDGAPMRRGRPTVAESLGPARAVSTGDFLFARAFGELTGAGSPRAVSALAAAALDLSQGEIDQQRAAFDLSLSEEAYLARCRRKTAALFSVACRLGAQMGGASPEAGSGLRGLADRLGALGGTLQVESPPGAATTLRASIPVRKAPGEADASAAAAVAAARRRRWRRRTLVSHAVVYGIVMLLLTFIWLTTGAGYFWPQWAIVGWGSVLAIHAWFAEGRHAGMLAETQPER